MDEQRESVALIGAGIMGQAIGKRLLECAHRLAVFDLDVERVAPLVEAGAEAADSAGDAVADTNVVILSLNSAAIVRSAVFGDAGVASGAREGTLIIDMSSIDPASTRTHWQTRLCNADCAGSIARCPAVRRRSPPGS